MTLNLALALISGVLWCSAYGWYFSRDLRHWWRRRRARRALYARFHAQRVQEYAAWAPRAPAPRPLRDVSAARRPAEPLFPPPAPPAANPASAPSRRGVSNVVPFPTRPAGQPRRPKPT